MSNTAEDKQESQSGGPLKQQPTNSNEVKFDEEHPLQKRIKGLNRKRLLESSSSHGGTDDEDYKLYAPLNSRKKPPQRRSFQKRSQTYRGGRSQKKVMRKAKQANKQPGDALDVDQPVKRKAGRPKGSANKKQSEKGLARRAVKFEQKAPPPKKKKDLEWMQESSESSSTPVLPKAQTRHEQTEGRAKLQEDPSLGRVNRAKEQDEIDAESAHLSQPAKQESKVSSNRSENNSESSSKGELYARQSIESPIPIRKESSQESKERKTGEERMVQTNLRGEVVAESSQQSQGPVHEQKVDDFREYVTEPGQQTLVSYFQKQTIQVPQVIRFPCRKSLALDKKVIVESIYCYDGRKRSRHRPRLVQILSSQSGEEQPEYLMIKMKRASWREKKVRRYRKVKIQKSEVEACKYPKRQEFDRSIKRVEENSESGATEECYAQRKRRLLVNQK